MPYVRETRAHPTTDGRIRVVLTLGEEKDAVWCHFFDSAPELRVRKPAEERDEGGDPYERVLSHKAVLDEVAAKLRPDASEDMVLRTLDWLSDTADAADAQRLAYSEALKKTEKTVAKWFKSQ